MYLGGSGGLNNAMLNSLNQQSGAHLASLQYTTGKELNYSVSSINTFDIYKLNMSKEMPVLRRTYDRMKHELKAKRQRLAELERDWDSLHSLNARDNSFRVPYGAQPSKKQQVNVTIMTADLGTGEKKDEYVNLDQLKSLILV